VLCEASAAGGLPPIRLHGLRHSAASLALQAGADRHPVTFHSSRRRRGLLVVFAEHPHDGGG
jgi:integrase